MNQTELSEFYIGAATEYNATLKKSIHPILIRRGDLLLKVVGVSHPPINPNPENLGFQLKAFDDGSSNRDSEGSD